MENSIMTRKNLIHHLIAIENGDIDEIMKDYVENSTVFTPEGIKKGLREIKDFFLNL